jgi:2,3-bisphosphoglycerate-dependent phosphoglycerate mutase
MIKSWRLNERMYGELTGLSKQMVKQRHGETQFKQWRRGFSTPPPHVSSFSQHYPGNDARYTKYLNDVRWSLRETAIRSIEKGRLTFHRKFPKSESLKDCMDRKSACKSLMAVFVGVSHTHSVYSLVIGTIPFFTERIVPEAVSQGKRVLISSSENAIRGLLMHLCEIPEDKITELEIPNGLPIIFDLKSKCVKLLDDGSNTDLLEKYNFGKAAQYLFRPCQNEDGSNDEECQIRFSESDFKLTNEEQATLDRITKRQTTVAS